MSEDKNCCCYENGKCLWTKRYYENNIVPVCEKVKDCYFKQLKRLQAENEELKHKNEILLGQLVINDGEDVTVQISQSQFNEYNELKAENERLSNMKCPNCNEEYLSPIGADLFEENKELKDYAQRQENQRETYYKEYCKLRKALEEIREILKGNKDGDIDEMIDKINEVLG